MPIIQKYRDYIDEKISHESKRDMPGESKLKKMIENILKVPSKSTTKNGETKEEYYTYDEAYKIAEWMIQKFSGTGLIFFDVKL
jgi:hypothetical protein